MTARSTSRRAGLGIVFAVAAAVGVGWPLRRSSEVVPGSAPSTSADEPAPPPTLAVPAAGPAPRAAAAPVVPQHPALPLVRVVATVDGESARGARIHADSRIGKSWRPHRSDAEAQPVGDDGVLELDLSEHVRRMPEEHRELWIQGLLPDGIADDVHVSVPAAAWPRPPPVEVALRFRRGAVLTGRVVDEDGTPISAQVQALRDEDTPPGGTRHHGVGVVAGRDGRFRLVADGEGPALIVVGRGDRRPTTLPRALVRGRVDDLGDVRLERGASLAGRIRATGLDRAKTRVVATWYGPAFDSVRPALHGQRWVVNRLARWSQLETSPDADGRFRLEGLEPGPWRLRVLAEDFGCALHPDAYAEVDRIVRAPDESIAIDADRALLRLEVADDAGLVRGATVRFEGAEVLEANTGTDGVVGIVLRAGSSHRLALSAPGRELVRLDVTAPTSGETRRDRVVLARRADGDEPDPFVVEPRTELPVVFLGPDGVPCPVGFRVRGRNGVLPGIEALDRRAVVTIRSVRRTSVAGATWFSVPSAADVDTIDVADDRFEPASVRVTRGPPTDGATKETAPTIVLRAR